MKNTETVTFKIDTELFSLFKKKCEEKRTTMSHEIRQFIVNFTDKNK